MSKPPPHNPNPDTPRRTLPLDPVTIKTQIRAAKIIAVYAPTPQRDATLHLKNSDDNLALRQLPYHWYLSAEPTIGDYLIEVEYRDNSLAPLVCPASQFEDYFDHD